MVTQSSHRTEGLDVIFYSATSHGLASIQWVVNRDAHGFERRVAVRQKSTGGPVLAMFLGGAKHRYPRTMRSRLEMAAFGLPPERRSACGACMFANAWRGSITARSSRQRDRERLHSPWTPRSRFGSGSGCRRVRLSRGRGRVGARAEFPICGCGFPPGGRMVCGGWCVLLLCA